MISLYSRSHARCSEWRFSRSAHRRYGHRSYSSGSIFINNQQISLVGMGQYLRHWNYIKHHPLFTLKLGEYF